MTKSKPAAITPEQATAILKAGQEKALKEFEVAYLELCKKHGCEIIGRPGITEDGRIGAALTVRIAEAQGNEG